MTLELAGMRVLVLGLGVVGPERRDASARGGAPT